MPVLSLRKEKH